jgi:hypothetical protein
MIQLHNDGPPRFICGNLLPVHSMRLFLGSRPFCIAFTFNAISIHHCSRILVLNAYCIVLYPPSLSHSLHLLSYQEFYL